MSTGTGPASGLVFLDFMSGAEMHFMPPSAGPPPEPGPLGGLVFVDPLTGEEMHFLPPSAAPTFKELAGNAVLSCSGAADLHVLHGLRRIRGSAEIALAGAADMDAVWSMGGSAEVRLHAADTSGILKGGGAFRLDGSGTCRSAWALRGSGGTVLAGSAMARLLRRVGGNGALTCHAGAGFLARTRPVAGCAALACVANEPRLVRFWIPLLSVPAGQRDRRRLSWGTRDPVEVWIDGDRYAAVQGGEIIVPRDLEIRQMLDIWDEPPAHVPTPRDVVMLTWTGRAATYRVQRQKNGDGWGTLLETEHTEYADGPLEDATYAYRIVALDDERDAAESEVNTVVVSSAPEPPSDLEWSWDDASGTLTLTWTASPSGDVAGYRVRSSKGKPTLDLGSAPVRDSLDTTYEQNFTNETGTYLFSVRAVDSDGNEEANISQVVVIPFENGAPAALPAEPLLVEARAISGGRIELEWLYDPALEYLGPGAAHEARIYWDGGTGEMDWSAPHATVAMNNPAQAARYSWQSGVLTDGQEYRLVVRIATAGFPDGIETENSKECSAVADTTGAEAPALCAKAV